MGGGVVTVVGAVHLVGAMGAPVRAAVVAVVLVAAVLGALDGSGRSDVVRALGHRGLPALLGLFFLVLNDLVVAGGAAVVVAAPLVAIDVDGAVV